MPGDVLEVRIKESACALLMRLTASAHQRVPEGRFYDPQDAIIPLDREKMVAISRRNRRAAEAVFWQHGHRAARICRENQQRTSGHPRGQYDNKELVAGTTLFIPVHAAGALFEVGDAMPAWAMAKSTSPRWRRRHRSVSVRSAQGHAPEVARAETPTHWISMGSIRI